MSEWCFFGVYHKRDVVHLTTTLQVGKCAFKEKDRKYLLLTPADSLVVVRTPGDKSLMEGEPNSYDVELLNGDIVSNIPEYFLTK